MLRVVRYLVILLLDVVLATHRGSERCVWSVMKRQDFQILSFSGMTTTASYAGEDGSQRENCNSQDQRMAAGVILNRTRESEMGIPAKGKFWIITADSEK
jgi:hypothetical protein